jgi:hypothetical protein
MHSGDPGRTPSALIKINAARLLAVWDILLAVGIMPDLLGI